MGLVSPLSDSVVALDILPGADMCSADISRHRLLDANRLDQQAAYVLQFTPQCVQLMHRLGRENPLRVDFSAGAIDHRRKFGGGKGQDIAKAVGLNKGVMPRVLDATAGLGRDAFALASLGCHVDMLERSPVVFALLEDGLNRAKVCGDNEVMKIAGAMSATFGSLLTGFLPASSIDVIYLDPMFPERQKSALVKKDMRFFHAVVGEDPDADALFSAALALDCARVVVKRPVKAPTLGGATPSHQIVGKSIRYDIYVKRKLA